LIDETQMPIAPEHDFKEKSTKLFILPSLRTHFNVRHPIVHDRYMYYVPTLGGGWNAYKCDYVIHGWSVKENAFSHLKR
jgi:hypothetical protein